MINSGRCSYISIGGFSCVGKDGVGQQLSNKRPRDHKGGILDMKRMTKL